MGIKKLTARVSLPYACADGRLVQVPGYDAQTGVFADFAPDAFEPVPVAPTRGEVVDALRCLWRPWSLFRFATKEDRAGMLSAVLTAVCRCSLDIAPGYMADASSMGAGKTKSMSALGALIRGSRAPVTPWVSGSGSESELAKKLVSLLIAGIDFIAFDNVVGTMSSSVLSVLLTDGVLSDRVLGSSTWFGGQARVLICASSNNASVDRDLSRRFIRVRIDPGVERANSRSFPFDPVEAVLSERMNIARSVLIVIRAYHVAGAPRSAAASGDAGYSQWERLVRQSVLWVGETGLGDESGIGTLGDPAYSIVDQAGTDDPDTVALGMLIRGIMLSADRDVFTARDLLKWYTLGERGVDEGSNLIRDGLDGMLAGGRGAAAPTVLGVGRALKFRRDRPTGGLVLRLKGLDRNGTALWSVGAA